MQKWMAWFKDLGQKGNIKDRGQPLERSGKLVKGKLKTVTGDSQILIRGIIHFDAEAIEIGGNDFTERAYVDGNGRHVLGVGNAKPTGTKMPNIAIQLTFPMTIPPSQAIRA